MTGATPRHVERGLHAAAAVVAAVMGCLLSLAVNLILCAFAAFSSTTPEAVTFIAVMVGELTVAAAFTVSFARWRDSAVSLAFCIGVTVKLVP